MLPMCIHMLTYALFILGHMSRAACSSLSLLSIGPCCASGFFFWYLNLSERLVCSFRLQLLHLMGVRGGRKGLCPPRFSW